MALRIERSEIALTEECLQQVEDKIGMSLPEQYRRFLFKHNGGKPTLSLFHYKSETGSYTGSVVDWFLAIYDGEFDNFESYFSMYKSHTARMPSNCIPIAHDPGGNLICISTSGPDEGAVYFWDHENEAERGELPSYKNMHLIADNFDEFLGSLRKWECDM